MLFNELRVTSYEKNLLIFNFLILIEKKNCIFVNLFQKDLNGDSAFLKK